MHGKNVRYRVNDVRRNLANYPADEFHIDTALHYDELKMSVPYSANY